MILNTGSKNKFSFVTRLVLSEMHKANLKRNATNFCLMAQLWWAELEDTNSLGTEAEHLCTVICASAVVLIPSSTIVRGKKLFKKKTTIKKNTF